MGADEQVKSSLRAKILLIASIVVLAAMGANALTSSYFFTRKQTESHLMWADAIARVLGGQLERILFLGIPIEDLQGFERQCEEAVTRNADLSYAYVVSEKGALLFHSAQSDGTRHTVAPAVLEAIAAERSIIGDLADDSHAVTVPVMDPRGVRVAHVIVGFPKAVIQAAQNRLLALTVGVDLLVYGLSMALLFFGLTHFVIRPLTRIVRSLERIRPGDSAHTRPLEEAGSQELNVVVNAFNRLLDRLGQHESELIAAKESAERANRAKSDFLAVMSHEIRTPLHAMLGMTEMLSRTSLGDRQHGYVSRLLRSGRALLAIINDILDFSRIDSNQTTLERIPFDLLDPFSDVVDTLSGSAAEKGLALVLDCPPAPIGVHGDPVRLAQIAMNLIGNAIKFTERGSVTVRVGYRDLTGQTADGRTRLLILDVVDTGIGIPDAAREQIFKAFCQADGSVTRRYGGSGLGLAIVERMVRLMQGEISVTSVEGEGSCFTVRIPFEPAEILPRADRCEQGPTEDTLAGIRVLLVEDDPVNQEVAHAMLEDSGVIVTVANNGLEAVDAAARTHFDLVFMDCHMPLCDGFEATARIRRDEAPGARRPIIALTADILPETRQRCSSAGMDDILTKPFSQPALLATIRRWTKQPTRDASVGVAAPPMEDAAPLFDPGPLEAIASLRSAGEKRLVARALELFLNGLPALVREIERGKADADREVLKAVAHQLKSSSANVGAARLSSLAAALESAVLNAAPWVEQVKRADQVLDCIAESTVSLHRRLDAECV